MSLNTNDSYPVENGDMNAQGKVDWADPVIKATPIEYMNFFNSLADYSLFAMFKNRDYYIGHKNNKTFYLPNKLNNNNTKLYVTKGNKWDVEEINRNPRVPRKYRRYDQYKNRSQSNSNYLDIIVLEF